ncbi:YheC/YheD family protein [Brevibacillus ginsengisoli]|uniref:YheC/YheD family protein n=1 Tax=Brevibacillus ginsengisoli TaxID=363854 RepID=UPI003CEBE108
MSSIQTGKWQKYIFLRQDYSLVPYLPKTAVLSERSLANLLRKYQKVVLKPNDGARGRGIMVAQVKSSGGYELQSLWKKRTFTNCSRLFRYLKHTIRINRYILQQCVPLAKVNDRLFDLRVMVQRVKSKRWKITGGLAKIAYRGMAVTNPEEYVRPMNRVLRDSGFSYLLGKINAVCIRASDQLSKKYPWITIIGFDIGVDVNGQVWIIEPNFHPAIYWFKQLPERKTYNRIISYKSKYG